MKFVRLSRLLHEISRFGYRNGFHSNFYSSKAIPSRRFIKPQGRPTTELYRRISPLGDPKVSVAPILDQWLEEGRPVDRESLMDIIKKLRSYKRFSQALEVSMWMMDKRRFFSSSDAAITLDLISKAQGIEQAEKYFSNIPEDLKGIDDVYGALLNSYATSKCVEKAEALMQKMRDLGFALKTLNYNTMLTLYSKTGKKEKFNALLKEMGKNGIVHDNYTVGLQLSAYGAVMDIAGMHKTVMMMESDPKVVPDWTNYTVAATYYTKAGLLGEAFEMLKKAEASLTSEPSRIGYHTLLIKYANIGRKDKVLEVWSIYTSKYRAYNKGYESLLKSLVKLGDLELAEKALYTWESQGLIYDIFIPNIVIRAYSNKGLFEKAEAVIDRAVSKGGKPDAWTWYFLVEGYLQYDQPQKAVEMMKKTIECAGTKWKPDIESLKACLERLKVVDRQQAKGFIKLLLQKDIISLNQAEQMSN